MPREFELAQVSVSRLIAPLDSPQLADFVEGLDPVNAVAEQSPGFVWRMVGDGENDATSIRMFGDDKLLVQISTWTTPQALWDYVFGDEHRAFLRRRREWFERMREAPSALWWVPAGHQPGIAEAEERLAHLREQGPTEFAFDFNSAPAAPTGATAR